MTTASLTYRSLASSSASSCLSRRLRFSQTWRCLTSSRAERQSRGSMYIYFYSGEQKITSGSLVVMNIFYFVKRWPRRNESTSSEKIFSLVESLVNMNHKVSLVSADTSPEESYQEINEYPIELVHILPNKIPATLSSGKNKPELAIFNTPEMESFYSVYLYNKWNKCARMLEFNHLKGLTAWRKSNYRTVPDLFINPKTLPLAPADPKELISQEEHRSIIRSDYLLCGNDYLMYLVKSKLNRPNACISNIGYPLQQYYLEIKDLAYRPYSARRHFVYMGAQTKPENLETINILINQVWPIIRKALPHCELHIYGSGYDKELNAKKKKLQAEKVRLLGQVEEVEVLEDYRLFLNPTRSSSGTKGKNVEAWYYHTPVVTSPVGAEGLFLECLQAQHSATETTGLSVGFSAQRLLTKDETEGERQIRQYYEANVLGESIRGLTFGGSCANFSFRQFAESAIELYRDKILWEQAVINAHKIMLKHQGEEQMEINLNYAFTRMEMAVHQSRTSKEYSEEWGRYLKSKELQLKLNESKPDFKAKPEFKNKPDYLIQRSVEEVRHGKGSKPKR